MNKLFSPQMKILGVDFGLKKIGLAISEGELAFPLSSLIIKSLDDGVKKITEVVAKEQIGVVILGRPDGEISQKVDKLANLLQKMGVKVELADETLSTQNAKQAMFKMGISQKKRRDDNAVSAAIILQGYLDERKG